jgi:hypothetical protein
MLKKLLLLITLLALVGLVVPAWAEEAKEEATTPSATSTQEEPSMGIDAVPFLVTGDFDVGYRWVDTNGNENKYREDLNYTSGPRLFNLNMNITPVGSSFFDLANFYASHLGGEPFQYLGVTVQKFGAYNFTYRRNQSIYFYHDIVQPVEDAGNPANARAGDFHTFNFDRTTDIFDFDVDINDTWNVFVKANRTGRKGESTTTYDVSRDEFELDKPLDWRNNTTAVGFEAKAEKVSVYFDQTWRDYEDDGRIFLPGLSQGEDPEDATILASFNQLLPYSFEMPQTTIKANIRPNPRTTVNVGYVYGNLDGEFDYDERAFGTAFNGGPLADVFVGDGTVDRKINLFDVDVTFDVGEITSIVGSLKVRRLEQEGSLTCRIGPCEESELEPGETTTTVNNVDSDIFRFGVRVFPNARAQITAGLDFENRKVEHIHDGEGDEEPNTKRQPTFFFNGVYVHPKANILAEYERGSYENPFTLVSPESLNRFKVRARLFPTDPLTITGIVYVTRINYEDVPDISVVPGKLNTDNYSIFVRYAFEDSAAYGGYTRQEWDQTIVNNVSTAGFGAGPPTAINASYDSKINNLSAGFNHSFNESFVAGADLNWFDNSGSFPSVPQAPLVPFPVSAYGSFPLDWTQFQLWGQFKTTAGYLLRIAYQRNDYNEELWDFDDYDANMVTVSVGYAF